MSDQTFTTEIELNGRFFIVEAGYETEWEDDSFDHDWGGRRQTEVCGHWEVSGFGVDSIEEVLADGTNAIITKDDPDYDSICSIASDRADDHCSDLELDPPERDDPDADRDDDRDYD